MKLIYRHDDDILKGCKRKDRLSQKMLFEKYYQEMMGVCMRYSTGEEEAKELLQIGFVKVFTKIDLFTGNGTLKSWIKSIMVNTAIDQYRKMKREQKVIIQEIPVLEETEAPEIEANLAAEDILKQIQMLPLIQRNVFNLFAIEGFSHREISDQLGITQGTSKWYLCEARKTLKKALSVLYNKDNKEYATSI